MRLRTGESTLIFSGGFPLQATPCPSFPLKPYPTYGFQGENVSQGIYGGHKVISRLWNREKTTGKEYRLIGLPRDKRKIEDLMRVSGKIVHISTGYDYMITKEQEPMENKKKYVVKELPNHPQKIEDLLNQMYQAGFEVLHMNDYSATFVSKD